LMEDSQKLSRDFKLSQAANLDLEKKVWRPRFLITVINANDRISRSNGQP
jgi:hypothetical protein